MKRRAYFVYAAIGLLALQLILGFALNAFGDYPENWDTYQSGVINPSSWNFHTPVSSCFVGFVSAAHPPPALSQPNYYGIALNNASGACTPGTLSQYYGTLTALFNATGSSTKLDMHYTTNFNSTVGVLTYTINLTSYTTSMTPYNTVSVTKDLHAGFNNTYTDLNDTVPSQPGGEVNVSVTLRLHAGHFGMVQVFTATDNYLITGANLIISSPTVNLLDASSRLQFNIAAYPGSSFVVNYNTAASCPGGWSQTASNQCTLNNLLTSYITISLAFATLLTLHVGTAYTRTLIPQSTVHVNFLVNNATTVYPYVITVIDLGNVFGTGSQIFINNANATITSGTLDAGSDFSAPLVPGFYNVLLVASGGQQYLTNISLGTSNFAISIQITRFLVTSNSGPTSTISFGVYWACNLTAIVANYRDTSNQTTSLFILLYNQTSLGSHLLYNDSFSGSIGSISANFNHVNSTAGTFLVYFEPKIPTGRFTINGVISPTNPACPSTFPSILPVKPAFSTQIYGLNQFTADPNAWNYVFGIICLIVDAGIFGARHAAIGYIVLAFSTMFFVLAIGFPIAYTLAYGFVITATTSFLVYRRRKPF